MLGFSVIEILISLSIVALTFSAGLALVIGLPASIADGHQQLSAAWRAQSALLEELPTQAGSLSAIDVFSKLITSTTSWSDILGRQHAFSFSTLLTALVDPDSRFACNQSLTGDWKHSSASVFTFSAGSLLPGDAASTTHPVTSLAVSSTTLAATVALAQNKIDPTLFLFDIASSSATMPLYLSGIDNAPSARHGIAAVALSENYAYAADAVEPNFATCTAGPSCAQLQIFDIHDRTNPQLITSFELPTNAPPFASGSSGQSSGDSIAYADGRIYLGLTKTSTATGDEFNIIDAHDPGTPVWLGGYPVGRTVTSIVVRGPYAYITTDDTSRELLILDIHDPTHITSIAEYNAPGSVIYGYGSDVGIASTTLFLTRTYTPNQPEFSLISVASMTAPALLGSAEVGTTQSPQSVESALIRSSLAFVLTDFALDFWNISDLRHPAAYRDSIPTPFESTSTAITCAGNTVYASSAGADGTGYLTVLTAS